MPDVDYKLYRTRFIQPAQLPLLKTDLSTTELFIAALQESPTYTETRGPNWRIGNVELVTPTSGAFSMGRTTRSTIQWYDDDKKVFLDQELETSPYTSCLFDAEIGLLAIASKRGLSPNVNTLARRLVDILSNADVVGQRNVKVQIDPIFDPQGFIDQIRSAFKVTRYTATFKGPNPFDADELLQKPLSVYARAINGVQGRIAISGDDLNRACLEDIVRSTSATGNESTARLRPTQKSKPINITTKKQTLSRTYNSEEIAQEKVLEDLRATYQEVRHGSAETDKLH